MAHGQPAELSVLLPSEELVVEQDSDVVCDGRLPQPKHICKLTDGRALVN